MFDDQNLKKIEELTKLAISTNKNLLNEEGRLLEALLNESDIAFLKVCTNKIKILMRKEVLFIQAAEMRLTKMAT